MNRFSLRSTILTAFRAEGIGKVLTGVAPPGWMEEEFGTWVETLQSKLNWGARSFSCAASLLSLLAPPPARSSQDLTSDDIRSSRLP